MNTVKEFLPYAMLAATALWVANGVWAFRDARRRGRSGILVTILVLGSFPFGVALWMLARPAITDETDEVDETDPSEVVPPGEIVDPDAALKQRANEGRL